LDCGGVKMNEILKRLRLENKKTQQEVARVLGYSSKSGYSMLENGNVELTISKAKVLADFYKVDPKIFLEV
jgi:transcriptional regulator with XRE-family HTH domain